MLSTHFTAVHQPRNQELRGLELCTRQAADFIERCQWEEDLRVREERYRTLAQRLDAEVHGRTADLEIKAAELSQKAALLDLAKDAIFVKSANGTISYWNEGATTLYGWTMGEALGRSPAELLHSQYPIPLSEIESGDDWEGEICHTKRNGSRIIVVSRWTKIQDSKGGLAGWLEINTDITTRKRAEESTRKLAARLLQMQDEERRRIARELHDSSGQTIAALMMNLEELKKTDEADGERAYLLSQAETVLQNLNKEIRTISHLLHPPLLDVVGLSSALQWYVDGFEKRSGIVTSLELSADFGRVNPDLEIAIFRVVQECLTNVHRHSGSSKAVVRLKPSEDVLLLGSGPVGVGLRGMRERALQLGGTLAIESDDGGTTVRAMFPIAKSALRSAEQLA